MYRILVPLNGGIDRATNQASYIANLPCADSDVEAVLAHTMDSEERAASEAMQQADRIDTVRRAKEALSDAGVSTKTQTLSSPPADGILSLAESESIDEIVMGGRKRSPAEKAILGSITQSVILNADIPVTVTGGE